MWLPLMITTRHAAAAAAAADDDDDGATTTGNTLPDGRETVQGLALLQH